MDTLRDTIKNRLRTRSAIDPAEEITARVDFLAQYLSASGARGFALGISGGQDSTLAGRLAQLAVEKLRKEGYPAEFWAIRLPYGVQADEEDARIALAFIRPDHSVTINIKPATDACAADVAQALGLETLNDFNKGNVKARQRMIAQYALAGEKGAPSYWHRSCRRKCHGIFTKFGDGAADILPLAGLSKRQGAQLLQALNAPDSTWLKVPTADLEEERPALPDEVALGVTYSDIDTYIEGSGEVSEKAAARIEHLWKIGEHKRHLPVEPGDTWWRR